MAGERIFIAEDEGVVAFSIKHRLEKVGYQVVGIAATAEEALSQIQALRPDLVLMDIRLAGDLDGIAAAQQIRDQLSIPIVYITAYSDPETLQRAKLTQPYGYLFKPFQSPELQTAIEIALHNHRQDQQLQEREQWLANTLHSLGDAIITTDSQAQITYLNPVAEQLTGWTVAESLNRPLNEVFQILDERTREPISHQLIQALQENRIVGIGPHALLISRNGKEIPIDDSIAPMRGSQGELLGAVLVFHDISERKQAEVTLQNLNAELEQRVQQRTEELQQLNAQLQLEILERQRAETEARRALQKERELSDLKSRFITTASHEFRTPLAIILTSAELLERTNTHWPAEKRLRYLVRIQEAVKTMTRILNDVLGLGRMDAGKLSFSPAPLNLQEFCHELLEELQLWVVDPEQIRLVISSPLEPVSLDRELLWQILTNLLLNAIKYSPEGGPVRLEVELDPEARGTAVVFRVHDRGMGIPPEDQARVFEAFHRGANVGTIPGTGLGLTIVQRCVEVHQGTIAVESTLNQGTLVTVRLPEVAP